MAETGDINSIFESGSYAVSNAGWHEEDSEWKAAQIAKTLEDNGVEFSSICEVGCGAGGILEALSITYDDCALDGYEVSPAAFELCRKRETARVHYFLEDLTQKDIHYDCLLCIDVFEHVENYLWFLKSIRQKARYKVFHIPLDLSVSTIFRAKPLKNARDTVGHLHYFTRETALESLKYCGYEIADERYTTPFADLPAKSLAQKLVRPLRKLAYAVSPHWSVRVLGGCSLIVLAK